MKLMPPSHEFLIDYEDRGWCAEDCPADIEEQGSHWRGELPEERY